jgi:two-component system, OmpR family, sensor kinase ParS
MEPGPVTRNDSEAGGRLLFRGYFFLAGGLLVAALVLNFVFDRMQTASERTNDPWPRATFASIEAALLATPATERPAQAERLAQQLGMPIALLDARSVVGTPRDFAQSAALRDDAGAEYRLGYSKALDQYIRIGPVPPVRDSLWLALLPLLFYASIFAIVGLWLQPILRDLRLLTNASQRFAADYREPLATHRETTQLRNLARNLDDMSVRIGTLIQNQRDLTAALSHEMRTPLARIRFALAVMQGQGDSSLQPQLTALGADVQDIDRLIATLLNYARLDHPDVRMNWQPTPVEPWLAGVLRGAALPDTRVQISQDIAIPVATMDARLMELALSNLVVNAQRYARSAVRVAFAREGNDYLLTIDDDGEGIPASERQNVFRAFTRLDSSRNRDTGGYGLGLAIVARIAALHRGRADVDTSAALGGARFVVRWPEQAA